MSLLSADEVAALLDAPDVVLLDVRSGPDGAGRSAYQAGHIPGARHTDYAADGWRERVGDVPGLLPEQGKLSRLLGQLGLKREHRIIVVPEGRSANDFAAAARIFWTLGTAGYRPIGILDGGTAGWMAAGRPVEIGAAVFERSESAPVLMNFAQRALASDVDVAVQSGGVLVDGRAPSYFRGEEKADQSKAYGHIPGAVNIDYVQAFDATTGRLKPRDELDRIYAPLGDGPVISYCNTGHTAALNWFVLSQVLGRSARLYDGSMTEWTQDPAHPVSRTAG